MLVLMAQGEFSIVIASLGAILKPDLSALQQRGMRVGSDEERGVGVA
jgi:hypothetical protein